MSSPFQINGILDSSSKLDILRLFTSQKGLRATGREIARLSGYSVPSTHESLKTLYSHNILNFESIGKQHIYSLNEENIIVQNIIRPLFVAESKAKRGKG